MFIVLPNQLYETLDTIHASKQDKVYIIEEPLFFYDKQRPLHYNKIKLAYLVACMRYYYDYLKQLKSINVVYVEYDKVNAWVDTLDIKEYIHMYKPSDKDVYNKFKRFANVHWYDTPAFLMSSQDLNEYHKQINASKMMVHAQFYNYVKTKLKILKGIPSQDKNNRASLPMGFANDFHEPRYGPQMYYTNAIAYINNHPRFKNNQGSCDKLHTWPITFKDAKHAFHVFIKERFHHFGKYQDAFDVNNPFLFHSFISPMLNIGLLCPAYIVNETLKVKSDIANTEGFLRQLVGWREYMHYLYEYHYDDIITSNHFDSNRRFANVIWKSQTFGLVPLDSEIQKGITYGYSHHIIRLMIFLNMFVMLQIHPDDVYKWFMENIAMDAYDWVMKTNIYCMGWYFTRAMTKPYISTSNYLVKMGNYPKGEWCKVWDAMFYTFLTNNKSKLTGGSRVYLRNLAYYENLPANKQSEMQTTAKKFIESCTRL
jgi:deoxyribodipyrimidine photolyase-related protein|uniref:Cryptochrome/DNA photolyase FAD-binding domain-containing protein n=1 Tax=viral metagenome TaxID=1070528 RepID=A0A6C0BGS1_9ZZZZ